MSEHEQRSGHARTLLRQVIDPTSVAYAVVTSAAAGVLTLIDPARRSVGGRLLLRVGTASVTGFMTWCEVRRTHVAGGRIGATAAAVGADLALGEANEALDARLHRFVSRRGARRPRLVLALFAATLTAALHMIGRRIDGASDLDEDAEFFAEEPVAIPEPVRELVSALLAREEGYGARELRAQLDAAQVIEYLGEDEPGFSPGVFFTVPEHLPRAVPAHARFPVIGRYRPLDGRSFDVFLSIAHGRLDNLTITTGDDWDVDDQIAWFEVDDLLQGVSGWPAPEELTFLIETPDGLKPLD